MPQFGDLRWLRKRWPDGGVSRALQVYTLMCKWVDVPVVDDTVVDDCASLGVTGEDQDDHA